VSGLRLHGYWRTSAAYRVRIALECKGLDFEYVPVHLVRSGGEQYSPEYRTLNPQSRVPALESPDGVLTQSMAIME
jgi:glutathione S-transferase